MVTWAQRPNLVFLTICLSDCKKPDIKVEKDRLKFKGVGGTDQKEHAVDIEFYKEIDPEVNSLMWLKSQFLRICHYNDQFSKCTRRKTQSQF